ncbi:ThuA domain-containing protein [Pedobacter sp. ASV28]|uniref:ThuA domain-containing protein n=1 Tax=Pedobacter sp. ASV28 TaxID=2795123 RepID=UPI0018ED8F62|nr:ThuA domain-containing protein [Pedobacter sp. ASV28]
MKFFKKIFLPLLLCLFLTSPSESRIKIRKAILIFSYTKGYRHQSIPAGIAAIRKLGEENGFTVDTSENVASFTEGNLKKYKAVIFLNPTGSDVFNEDQKQAFKSYINKGGGFVGIHAATDFCYEWEWYGKMVGAYFTNHPKVQQAKLVVVNAKDKLNKGLPQDWLHTDEWYNFKSFNKDVKVLVRVDEASYQGGKMNNDHPVVWYQNFEGGKVFYTALGHTEAAYKDVYFLKHLLLGLQWTMK